MEVLVEDMARVLGAEVQLPGGDGIYQEQRRAEGGKIEVDIVKSKIANLDLLSSKSGMKNDDNRGTPPSSKPHRPHPSSSSPSPSPKHSPSFHPISRENNKPPTTPPIATSPSPPTATLPALSQQPMKSNYPLESKRKSGSDILIEKGEEGLRASCHRMSVS
ncbi:MAG: hypothetical protein Q9180_009380 [Flavoplaca navasiana]